MTCDRCFQSLEQGDHGEGLCPFEPRKHSTAIAPDEIPGGQWFENGFETPQKFYSHSEHRAALAARGCEIRAKWAGPNDKIMSRWDAPSAYSLEKAKEMYERIDRERQEKAAASKRAQEEFPITVTTLEETFTVQGER